LPKKTISTIIDSGNDYLVVVKRNQKNLHQQIDSHISETLPTQDFQQTETTRDRLINRTVKVFTPPPALDPLWIGVNCVITVFRHGTRGQQNYQSSDVTFYLSSLSPNSSKIPQGIQQHWSIENRLHWVKDVVTKEDSSPQLHGYASTNISILKSWVFNLLKINGYDSLTEAIDALSHNLKLLRSFCF
jgi:predicted transposase YbfD/YdcC